MGFGTCFTKKDVKVNTIITKKRNAPAWPTDEDNDGVTYTDPHGMFSSDDEDGAGLKKPDNQLTNQSEMSAFNPITDYVVDSHTGEDAPGKQRSMTLDKMADLNLNSLVYEEGSPPELNFIYTEVAYSGNLEGMGHPADLDAGQTETTGKNIDQRLRSAVGGVGAETTASPVPSSSIHWSGEVKLTTAPANSGHGARVETDATCSPNDGPLSCKSDYDSTAVPSTTDARLIFSSRMTPEKMAPFVDVVCMQQAPGSGRETPNRVLEMRCVETPKAWVEKAPGSPDPSGNTGSGTVAWEMSESSVKVGGIINRTNDHLRLVASTDDGNLGGAIAHALAVIRSGVSSAGFAITTPPKGPTNATATTAATCGKGLSIRVKLNAKLLEKVVGGSDEDMAQTLGLSDLDVGFCMHTVRELATAKHGGERDARWRPSNPANSELILFTKPVAGVTDCEWVGRICESVRRLRNLEREFCKAMKNNDFDVMPVETLDYLVARIRSPLRLNTTLTKLHLDAGIVERYRHQQTLYGGTLRHMIRGNAYCPQTLTPRATDPEAYRVFPLFLDSIIKRMTDRAELGHPAETMYGEEAAQSLQINASGLFSYRVRFTRNLKNFGFAPVLGMNQYLEIEELCRNALVSYTGEPGGVYFGVRDIRNREPGLFANLVKKRLVIPNRLQSLRASGIYRYWPMGRGIYVSRTMDRGLANSDLVVQVNANDHLKVICVDWTGTRPGHAYARAVKLMHHLDSQLMYSWHPDYGFLSPSLWNLGCGLRLSALVKLRHLVQKGTKFLEATCKENNIALRPGLGIGMPLIKFIYDVGPRHGLGYHEAQLLQQFAQGLEAVCKPLVGTGDNCQAGRPKQA